MTSVRFASTFLIFFSLSSGGHAAHMCTSAEDPLCNSKEENEELQKEREERHREATPAAVDSKPYRGQLRHRFDYSKSTHISPHDKAKPLQPVRAYLRADEIPPVGAGAYGLVVFHSKPTSANRLKLKMVCNSFVAFFPRNETATVPLNDQMITVWPLDNPDAKQAKKDDCDYAIDHYDLTASESAISDAQLQHANFDGEGPYLVGWSPSSTRGVPDALVLVMDMSADNSQAQIDHKFLFWKGKIVENPSAWRDGFSVERLRVAIRIFADQYGQAMLDAIKLIGDKKP
jgi:hypothetical protein